jgi:hypothetical protein
MFPSPCNFEDTHLRQIMEKPCWYVSFGENVGHSFQLALGKKVRRSVPIRADSHSREYCEFEGEYSLLVWCDWRLEREMKSVGSSRQTLEERARALTNLVGLRTARGELALLGDLVLYFENGFCLRMFADRISDDPKIANWELFMPGSILVADNVGNVTIEAR